VAVHPQVQAILDAGESRPRPESLEEARQNYAETSLTYVGEAEDVAQVRDVHLDEGARLRLYVPAGDVRGAILWIHGGGWIMGTLEAYDALCRALANRTGAVVGSVDYRLAPEHPYPEPVQDVERALAALQREAPGPYAIAGDSAGGNLAAVVARRHRADLRFQLLVYPVTDAAMATDSYRRFGADATYRVAKEEMAFCWEQYAPGRIGQGPDASPLRAPDLTGVPPALVIVAEYDPLTDEGLDYAERLQAAGVEARTSVYEGMVHGFFRWRGAVDAAGAAMDEASAALRAALQA
jgi:acetyl esterase